MMFVIPPPPPRYNLPQVVGTSNGPAVTAPAIEITNVLSHPTGPQYQLSVGEGTYTLRDSIHLSTPPPHPHDGPAANPNPLATTIPPPKAGVKLSICITDPGRRPPALYRVNTSSSTTSNLGTYSIKEQENESRSSHDTSSNGRTPQAASRTPVFGEDNVLLSPTLGKDALKRKKPKASLLKSNSQFISRVIPHDNMSKRLQEHNPQGSFVFVNIDRAYQWLDITSPTPGKGIRDHNSTTKALRPEQAQPLMKILFAKAHMLCHDINMFTKSSTHIDVIMGSSTGDIVWFEAYSQKYARINKGNVISHSPVSDIRWLPGSENHFLASHMDGTLIVYDKDRDDAAFIPEAHSTNGTSTSPIDVTKSPEQPQTPLHINKSVNSKNQKSNPVASWKISDHRITGIDFSPDSRHLAVVSEDGSLRIIDFLKEVLTDLYPSYYGAFSCVCWSADGKYVLTGGQDDLVSIWSLAERCIVARCPGHHSWVTAVAFDPWRRDGRNYRFGSVGEDRRLLLWDFNVGMLRRPKAASIRHRASLSSHVPSGRDRTESRTAGRLRSTSSLTVDEGEEALLEHKVESRTVTAELPPVMSKVVDDHPLSWLGFQEDCIVTACVEGHVRIWNRPQDGMSGTQHD